MVHRLGASPGGSEAESRAFHSSPFCHPVEWTTLTCVKPLRQSKITGMHKTSGGDRMFTIISSLTFILVVSGFVRAQVPSQGTLKHPIVDSRMTKQEAFD